MVLFETIKVQDNQLQNISFHNERFNSSRKAIFKAKDIVNLNDYITLPENITDNIYKCRVIYEKEIERVEIELYKPRAIRSLKLVESDNIDYKHKFYNRSNLNELFEKRGECDDILIIKNGFVTDTSFSNVIFFDGRNWVTPSTPLLQGTKRQLLLKRGLIKEAVVRLQDIFKFKEVKLINAMMDFYDSHFVEVVK